MSSFGAQLRRERESRNKSIEDMAAATGIQRRYLEALERNESAALPGRAFGKLYIRAYAEVLDFDPRSLIEEYDRELQLQQPAKPAERTERAAPRPVEAALARWRAARTQAAGDPEHEAAPSESETVPLEESVEEQSIGFGAAPEAPPAIAPAIDAAGDPVPDVPNPPASRERPARRRALVAAALAGLVVVSGIAYFVVREPEKKSDAASELPLVERSLPSDASAVLEEPQPPVLEAPPPASAPSPAESAPPVDAGARLRVSESGLGRRIVNRRVQEENGAFAIGDVAWFATRVLGGTRGDSIRHVWLHDDHVVQLIRLDVGGASWRTYSNRRLGAAGPWAVEARDESGRVLSRADFVCSTAAR